MTDVEIRPRSFLIGWLVGGVIVYPVSIVLLAAVMGGLAVVFTSVFTYRANNVVMNFLMLAGVILVAGTVIGFSLGVIQRWLMRRYLCWTADGWTLYSTLGGTTAAVVAAVVYGAAHVILERRTGYSAYAVYGSTDSAAIVVMPIFVGVISVIQWLTLRHAVRQALLWVLANVVGGLIFSGMFWINAPRIDEDLAWIIPFIAVLGQAFVTGFVMLWLFEKLAYPVHNGELAPVPVPVKSRSVWDDAI